MNTPIVGDSKIKYAEEAVKAIDVKLSEKCLEELYQPHTIAGAL